jgi:ligand-binding sensor domain-containing protein
MTIYSTKTKSLAMCGNSIERVKIVINGNFGKEMKKETKLRIHNITAKAALKCRGKVWVLKEREEQRLEAAEMKFLRHLLGIAILDKEKNQCVTEKMGHSTE